MIVLQVSICMVLVLLVNYRKLFLYILLNPSSELCLCSCISCYILKPVNGVNTALVVFGCAQGQFHFLHSYAYPTMTSINISLPN